MYEKKVIQEFENHFGGGCRVFAAPGRINLIGEHTDYNEGFVLPAAIDKKIWLAIAPLKGGVAKIRALDMDQGVEFSIHEPYKKLPHWAFYPYGVVKELQAAGYYVEGFQAVFTGDIPQGAGLSSSAALESVFATALNTLFKLQIDKLTLARICQLAEHHYAGVKCGIMDQFASLHGRQGLVMKLDCRSLQHEYYPSDLDGCTLLLADTRVKHSLASSEYNQRRAQCEEGVHILQKHMPSVKSLRDVTPKDIALYKALMPAEVAMRCEYVTEENQRVLQTTQALEAGDLRRVGQLLFQSHEGLRRKYQVSCPELDLLADTARQIPGLLGARMMGGGFGGCTINLVEKQALDQARAKLSEAYEKAFGNTPLFYQVNTAEGASELT